VSSVAAPPPGPRAPGPSLRPALVVVVLALVIVIGGGILALAGTPSARQGGVSYGPSARLPGSPLLAQPAAAALAHIESGGEPPGDVVSALAVPAGSAYLGSSDEDAGVSQFDRSVKLSVARPASLVKRFFVALLADRRWVTDSLTTTAGGAVEVIAQRNGSDGYQWRVGVNLSQVHGAVSAALGGGGSALTTAFSIRLYQVADAS
jgi:hypothetical protein